MRLLEGTEMWNTWEVARRVNELAEETRAKLDYLFVRMDSIEGVGRDKAVPQGDTRRGEPADWDDEGDPGECPECGAPYQIVRPGKFQETCRCYEVATLEREVARVQREHEALMDYNERLVDLKDPMFGAREELREANERLTAKNAVLRAENKRLRADNAVKSAALATMADWNRAVEEGR